MANITETAVWETGVREVGAGEPVTGGPQGTVNQSLQDLANRTAWLKKQLTDEIASINASITALTKSTAAADELALKQAQNLADVPDKAKARKNLGITTQTEILQKVYPVGSLYISTIATNPATLFGFGTWVKVEGRVILGANAQYPVNSTGGEASHTLTVSEMPAHTHTALTNESGAHTHSGTAASAGEHHHGTFGEANGSWKWGLYTGREQYGSGSSDWDNYSYNTSTDGAHTHTLTIAKGGAHAHTITVKNTGGGTAHNNMPPYFAAYIWRRTK